MGDTVSSVKPYDAQRHKLEFGWNEAKNVYNQAAGAGPYQGGFYSGLNGLQQGSIDQYGQALGGLSGLGGQMSQAAQATLGNSQLYGQNANQIYQNYGGPATAGITARVNSYMQDPALQASINAAKTDITRDLKENQLPGIDSSAAMNGNTNSSRTGIAEGLAMRGANDKSANVDAQMRSSAYNQALGAAQNDYFGGANTALQANNQVGQTAQMGQNAAFGALGLGQGIFQGQQQAGGLQQQDANAQLQANRAQYDYQNGGFRQNLLNNYLNGVGGAQWGSTTSAPANNGAGASGLGGLVGTVGGGILGSFFGNPTMGAGLGNLAGQGLGSLFG